MPNELKTENMKSLTKTIYIAILSLALLSFNSHSQNVSQNDSLEIKLKEAALDIISNAILVH